jgi:putative DNA primase/helicase
MAGVQILALARSLSAQLADRLCWDEGARIYREWQGVWLPLPGEERLHWLIVEALEAGGIKPDGLRLARELEVLLRQPLSRALRPKPGVIAFRNGTLDALTLELREHDRADGLVHLIPYDWDMTAPVVEWDNLTRSLFGEDGQVERLALQTHIGLALMGDLSFHRTILIRGAPDSGKTTLLRVPNLLQGRPPDEFADQLLFSADPRGDYARHECRDWPLVCMDEFPSEALREEEMFKRMSAHSGVSSRRIYEEPIYGQWRPKLLMASNDIPAMSDKTGAVKRRLLILECQGTIPAEKRDRNYLQRVRPELPGIAMLCLIAAVQGLDACDYPISDRMRMAYEEALQGADQVQAWVEERCVLARGQSQAFRPIYDDYVEWADANGHKQMSKIALSRRLTDYAPWGITREKVGGGAHVLQGIALKSLDLRMAQADAQAAG